METTQNVPMAPIVQTQDVDPGDIRKVEYKLTDNELVELKPKQDLFIDYMAFGSFTMDATGRLDQMTDEEVAAKLGVNRRTLSRWRRSIPGYAELIRKRRIEKFKVEIEDGVWRGLILKAMSGEQKQAEMVLSHFSDYVPPAQRVEHKVEGLADLIQNARAAKRDQDRVIDSPLEPLEAAQALLDSRVAETPTPTIPTPQTALETPTMQMTETKPETPAPMRVVEPPDDDDDIFDPIP